MPPTKDLVYSHFKQGGGLGRDKTQTCNYCEVVMAGNPPPARLKAHLRGGDKNTRPCQKCPGKVIEQYRKELEVQTTQKAAVAKAAEKVAEYKRKRDEEKGIAESEEGPKKQLTMEDWGQKQKDDLDRQFARFFYHSGTPFHVSEDPELRAFLNKLVAAVKSGLPVYNPPCRKRLAGDLLEAEYESVMAKLRAVFDGDEHLTLQTDGWSNIRRESVLNYIVAGQKGCMFLKADFPKENTKNADYIAERIDEALKVVAELKLKPPVSTLVTDNAAVMLAAHKVLDEAAAYEDHRFMLKVGCVLHQYQLLFKDICDLSLLKGTVTALRGVARFFRNRFKPAELLKKHQQDHYGATYEFVLPGKTRFGSHYLLNRFFLHSEGAFKSALASRTWDENWGRESRDDDEGWTKDKVKETLSQPLFWERVKLFHHILKPLYVTMRKADADGPGYTPWVYWDMIQLQEHFEGLQSSCEGFAVTLPAAQRKVLVETFKTRWQALHQPVHSLAMLVNPALLAKDTDLLKTYPDARNDARELFSAWSDNPSDVAQAFLSLSSVKKREGSFRDPFIWDRVAFEQGALRWWETFGYDHSTLAAFAVRALSAICVTGGAERNWSTFSFIHSKSRNRLYCNRVEKLVFVYSNLRLLRKAKGDIDYLEDSDSEDL